MATVRIGNRNTAFQPAQANTTYLLANGKLVDSDTSGIYNPVGVSNMHFQIKGRIESIDAGILLGDDGSLADRLEIRVAESGRIDSQQRAIDVNATNHRIVNAGMLHGSEGVRSVGSDGVIVNSGTMEASSVGIVVSGLHSITNSGSITGGVYGIALNANADGNVVRNTGTLRGQTDALMGSTSGDRFINSGEIQGDVSLRAGDDTFVFKGGSIAGMVKGGQGYDQYVIHSEGAVLLELPGEGFDIVKSSVSFTLASYIEQINLIGKGNINATGNDQDNHVQGNAGRNILRGEGGIDFLIGMAGNDKLFGGDGADIFNFQKGSGTDTVMDFEAGIDELQIGGLKGATDFADMMANHVEARGADIWITYGSDVVILKDTAIGELVTGDFVFG